MAEKKYTGAPFGTQTARYTIRLISFLGQLGGVFMTPINRFRIINRITLHALLYICHAKKFAMSGSLTAFAIVSLYVSF